jgi:DNA-binding winged helix-turn-helix (wHTH) protein/Tol biopolymer transport system component
MAEAQRPVQLVRFATFEVDLDSGELRRNGLKLKLSGQPFQVLAILLERPGSVVTREELQKRLWPDTFVDFDHNLNAAINKIREVLGDSAENPRFVETVPKRGYRFIAPVATTAAPTDQGQLEKPADPSKKPRNRLYFRVAMFGAVVLGVGLLVALWIARTQGTPKVVRFTRLTSDGQNKIGPLVTDGVRVYFNEWLPDGRLVIAQLPVTGGEVTTLSVPLKVPIVQDISKDGTELLVANDEGRQGRSIWIQPVAGGSPHRVGTVLTSWGPLFDDLSFAAFAAEGTRILYSYGYDVYSVGRDGSNGQKVLTVGHLTKDFRYSQDSRMLRFSQFDPPFEPQKIMSVAADGTSLDKLVDGGNGRWTADGRYFVFVRQFIFRSDLWALRESGSSRWQRRSDPPIQLTAGPLDFRSPSPAKSGNQIFAIGISHHSELVRYDTTKGEFVPYLPGISAANLAFSADGQWLAYTSSPDGNLWRSRVDGSEKVQLTFSPLWALGPTWSPDGKQIAFTGILPGGPWNAYIVPSSGGSPERLSPSDQTQLDVGWSPDGKSLVLSSGSFAIGQLSGPEMTIAIIDLSSRRVSTLPGSRGLYSPRWSPDGRYVAGTSIKSENLMLFDTSTQNWTKPCDCVAAYPTWSHDGKYIYFRVDEEPGKGFRIARLWLNDSRIETVAEVGNAVRWTAVSLSGPWFGLTPDDSLLLPRDLSTQEIYALEMQWQ